MIKTGQIYKTNLTGYIVCVTNIQPYIDGKENPVDDICCILQCGEHQIMSREYIEKIKLIAEYPTWQEAVNSKEFNDD